MNNSNQDTFQELHHGYQEYCRESGPLNSKKGSFPAALLNGLELVAAALAALALVHALLSFSIVASPLSILGDRAYLEVDIHNWPEDGQISYTLSSVHAPDEIIASGTLFSDPQDLEFTGLDSETEYILSFFLNGEKVDDYGFWTGPGDQLPRIPTVPSTTESTTQPATEPTTEPTTVPTTEPTTEPTTVPTTVPTEPVPQPTVRPTQPEPEPEPTPEPTTEPTTEPTVPAPTPLPGAPSVENIYVFGVDGIDRYYFFEKHKFTGIVSAPNYQDIVITQTFSNGWEAPIEEYELEYDPEAQTLAVTFMGYSMELGEGATSIVSLTLPSGETIESTQVIRTPSFDSLSIDDVRRNPEDPTELIFTISGSWTPPSVGFVARVQLEIYLQDHYPELPFYRGSFDSLSEESTDFWKEVPCQTGDPLEEDLELTVVLTGTWYAECMADSVSLTKYYTGTFNPDNRSSGTPSLTEGASAELSPTDFSADHISSSEIIIPIS